MPDTRPDFSAQEQLFSPAWTTVDDIRDRVSRHSDLMNSLVSTMLNQEILLDRLTSILETHTAILSAMRDALHRPTP